MYVKNSLFFQYPKKRNEYEKGSLKCPIIGVLGAIHWATRLEEIMESMPRSFYKASLEELIPYSVSIFQGKYKSQHSISTSM